MAYILRFLDRFLPDSMCTNPSDLIRGYILVGLIFTNLIIGLMMMASLAVVLDLGDDRAIALSIVSVCLAGYAVVLVLLRRTENYTLCSNLLLLLITGVIQWGISITGGYLASPILQIILLVPVTAFLLLGLRAGVAWLGITLGLSLLNYVAALYGVGYVQMLEHGDVSRALYVFLQFCLVALIGAALFVYETLNGLLRQELQEERIKLQHWASHDDLTGIANRFEFFRRLKAGIDEAQAREHKVGVVYIDLDGFKPVNDEHGHHMGDAALKAVAARLQKVLRLSDTTARLGGDEFGLILPGIHVPEDIETIMPKILEAIRRPIEVDGVEIQVRGSCGVAIFPNHSENYDDLCRYADTAMYRAKEKTDAWLVFEESMSAPAHGH